MTEITPKWIVQVEPIIIYPRCHRVGGKQDCFNCNPHVKIVCKSPRGLCVKQYYNHKRGCPNYGKNDHRCPPNVAMFNVIYDLSMPIYAIYNVFDFREHVERMRKKHPCWSQRQLECCLYWQGKARKQLRERIDVFKTTRLGAGRTFTDCPEGMGVNVTETMKNAGVELEWPPHNTAHQIAFAALPLYK